MIPADLQPEKAMLFLLSGVYTSSETQGQLVGRETKSKRAGKNSTSKKYKLKIGAPGDKHCTDQFQTAEQILAPDWAENLLYFSAQSAGSKG